MCPILIVDDDPSRVDMFRRNIHGLSMTWVTTAKLAIGWLTDHTPKLIFLDYDLHLFGLDKKESGSGEDIARWIAKNSKRFSRTFTVIHSVNNQGARRLSIILHKAKLMASEHPCIWDQRENLDMLTTPLR